MIEDEEDRMLHLGFVCALSFSEAAKLPKITRFRSTAKGVSVAFLKPAIGFLRASLKRSPCRD